VPIAQGTGSNLAITVMFKEFGIRLNFTPIVQGDRIHLKVRPEVSTLDFANAIQLNGFRIPALSTRRTETELELQNHQTFAIAGLLNNTANETMQKIPGIGDIPILGQLFKSKAAQKNQTELVVMITPEILPNNSPGAASSLPRTPQPFLPPLGTKDSVAPLPPLPRSAVEPAPANTRQAAAAPALVPVPVPAAPPATAATSAATLAAMTPSGSRVDTTGAEKVAAASQTSAAPKPPTKAMSDKEQKALARAHQEEVKKAAEMARAQAVADAKAKKDEDARLQKQAEDDAKKAAADAKKKK